MTEPMFSCPTWTASTLVNHQQRLGSLGSTWKPHAARGRGGIRGLGQPRRPRLPTPEPARGAERTVVRGLERLVDTELLPLGDEGPSLQGADDRRAELKVPGQELRVLDAQVGGDEVLREPHELPRRNGKRRARQHGLLVQGVLVGGAGGGVARPRSVPLPSVLVLIRGEVALEVCLGRPQVDAGGPVEQADEELTNSVHRPLQERPRREHQHGGGDAQQRRHPGAAPPLLGPLGLLPHAQRTSGSLKPPAATATATGDWPA